MGKQKTVRRKPTYKRKGNLAGKKSCALKDDEVASYGVLLKKRGDGSRDRDHIPSFAALVQHFKKVVGKDPTPPQKSAIKRAGQAIVLKKTVHRQGRTYGGKNTKAQQALDGKDLNAAAKRDVAAYQGIVKPKTIRIMKSMIRPKGFYVKMMKDIAKNK
ncbi:MAG: hypothetical protein P4L64_10445 [Caulobacteraceae bacterium]|nr:hypothetical protein [Caulobacteraceae bacterium]